MPTIAAGAAEWLQRTSFSTDAVSAELCGRLAFLAAWLRRSASLPVLPDEHREALADAFTVVPVQAPTMDAWRPAYSWLQVASLAEFHGHRELARLLVDALASHAAHDGELLALCEGQRGRIARTSGDLDDAAEHYADAIRRTTPLPKRDAWTRALCGLANVHIDRGNYPAAERCLRRALTAGPQVAAPTRVHPWMGLAMVRRKRGDLVDAMLCAWNAFDLIADGMPQRADLLVTLAECASDLGDHAAAINGFQHALRLAVATRVRIAAATGLVQAHTRQFATASALARKNEWLEHAMAPDAVDALTQLDELLQQPLAPQELTLALLVRTEAWVTLADAPPNGALDATRWLDRARALIAAHGYHEYAFRVEALVKRLEAREESIAGELPARAPALRRRQRARPTVVQRLAEYSSAAPTAAVGI